MKVNRQMDEHWSYRMQEMVLLPVDDDRRRAFEAEIARAGDSIKQAWLNYIYEEEQLRLELLDVECRYGMLEHLLAMPHTSSETVQPASSLSRWLHSRWGYSCVGTVLMLFFCGLGWVAWKHTLDVSHLHTLALLAMNDHVNESKLDVITDQPLILENALRNRLPFELSLPDLGESLILLGGRKCVLGTHPVLFSRWKGGQGEYTVFQFQPSDFSLQNPMKQTLVQPKGPATVRHPCEVLVWTQDNKGYIVVADSGSMLNTLSFQ